MAKSLQNLFAPKSIVIVGASNKKNKIGTILVNNLTKLGYKGKIFYVNPSYKILKLKKCYPSISNIGKKIDCAVVAVPAKFVADVVRDGSKFVKNFVVISAGFAETGKDGLKREKELKVLADKYKVNILGPNCLGYIVPSLKLNASFAGGMPGSGNIAFISQSGALAVALMDMAKEENLKFSHVISIGNKMQIDEADLIEYFGKDSKTEVIGMYLEGIKDGKRFIEAARKVSRVKPIVILKAGKTEKAQKAISSHTGALAGSDAIMNAAFEKVGVIRAQDLEEFFQLLTLASFQKPPLNNKVAVVTNAGGAGVITTDAFKDKKIELASFSESLKEKFKRILPPEASYENPVDLLGDADVTRYVHAFDKLNTKDTGTIVAVLTPQDQTPVDDIANAVINLKKHSCANVVAVFIGGQRIKSAVGKLKINGVPNFTDPDRAINALNKYYSWSQFVKQKITKQVTKAPSFRKNEARGIVAAVKKTGRKALLFTEASEIMKQYGIAAVETFIVSENIPEQIPFPLVVKVDSDQVLHKSDKQGVVLNVSDMNRLIEVVAQIKNNFPNSQIIAQPMLAKQTEIIMGIKKDPIFGPIVVAGLGGIYTEVFKMVDFYISPMTRSEVEKKVLESNLGFLFKGIRGQNSNNLEEFAAIIENMMLFAQEVNVEEVDINPLFIYNDGKSAVAVDIKVIIA